MNNAPRLNDAHPTPCCKICGGETFVSFALPASKKTGHPIPDLPDDCPYFECRSCHFCFSTHLDNQSHTDIYGEDYWANQDPDWYGRVSETMRLVMFANSLARRAPDTMDVLDFGCGIGGFVDICRRSLQINAWGTDIIPPKVGGDFFLPQVDRRFDIIVSCEVIEHLPDPRASFESMRSWLKPGGAIAFQTAQYDPNGEKRDWWYVGPDNGHISLYARETFDFMYGALGGKHRALWRDYPGVQAWLFN
ncbi:MAG: class I SAM-dependent methyltransferase [Alphaproteobacteria bacterium]|nr:class I SAM-dependent methyltransferase [Alphaproteobacteria bacterium]